MDRLTAAQVVVSSHAMGRWHERISPRQKMSAEQIAAEVASAKPRVESTGATTRIQDDPQRESGFGFRAVMDGEVVVSFTRRHRRPGPGTAAKRRANRRKNEARKEKQWAMWQEHCRRVGGSPIDLDLLESFDPDMFGGTARAHGVPGVVRGVVAKLVGP